MYRLSAATTDTALDPATCNMEVGCECALRVAADTLLGEVPSQIGAVRVVGVLGRDDVDAFNALVAEISGETHLDAHVQLHAGSFSVRFSRPC